MKQVIPFYKEIVFKTNIATITSISLEHEENIFEGEVTGNFIVFGKYKVHNDTTEELDFKYKLPFTALIPDDVNTDTVEIDVENFTFDQIEEDVLRIDIDFVIMGEVINNFVEEHDDSDIEIAKIDREIDEILGIDEGEDELEILTEENINDIEIKNDENNLEREENVITDNAVIDVDFFKNNAIIEKDNNLNVISKVSEKEIETNVDEYITYHVHLVKENETLEQIITLYKTNIDYLKEYNEVTEIKIGDKLIIPEYGEE